VLIYGVYCYNFNSKQTRNYVKKIAILSITSIFLFGLIFQGGSIFGSTANASRQQENPQPAITPQLIKVVSAQATTKIIAVNFSAGSADIPCIKTAAQSADLVQSTGIINLNQPASCFSLKISSPTFEPVKLSVMPLNLPPVKVLVAARPGPVISPGGLSQAPLKSETPVLPAVSLGVIVSFAIASRRKIFRTASAGVLVARQALSLQQLRVLRC